MDKTATTILIVDDHSVFRLGMSALLNAEEGFTVAGNAENGCEAVSLALKLRPDVIIMDVELPYKDGIAASDEILKAWPEAKILLITTYATSERIAKAVESGVLGAIMKSAGDDEIVAAIRAVAEGKECIAGDIRRMLREDPPVPALSVRQQEVLDSIARGLSNADIARQYGISVDMVKKHANALFHKINAANRSEAVAIALRKQLLKL